MSEGQPKPKSRGGHWKRPPTKVYAYNYDVGELYYKPMLNHLDKKSAGLETEVPGPRTFAERLATDPLYNKKKPVDYVTSEIPQAAKKEVSYDDEDKAFRKRLDDILGDYKLEDEAPKRGTERPDRFALPSLSDQILDSAGLSKMRGDSIDDRLAEARRRPFREPTPAEDDIDALLKKASANRAAALSEENFDKAIEESLNRRRNLLRDLNSELAKIDGEIEQYGSSSRQHQQSRALQAARSESSAAAESVMSSSAKMSAMSSTSLNVKQRRVKTTITTETVRC